MTLGAKDIENLILQGIPGAVVRIENLRTDGQNYYTAEIASPVFAGKTRIEQHRMVYASLKDHMDFDAQPLSLRTLAKEAV